MGRLSKEEKERRRREQQLKALARGQEVQRERKRQRQEEFLFIIEKNLWNISDACRRIGINRKTFYRWMEEEPDFAERFNDIRESRKDFVEAALLKNCAEGKSPDIKLFLTTQARDRGYVERRELDVDMSLVERAERGEMTSAELLRAIKDEQRKIEKAIEAGLLDVETDEG